MKNKLLLIGLIICQTAPLRAIDKPSVYDPLGALSLEERGRIEAEGRTVVANRQVSGQDLLIQIDFLSEDEFDVGGVTGRDELGRTLFSLGTYANWSIKYMSQPAVLMLFLDRGNGEYELDALNFNNKLMDEGIPDLVRRYIRDEIMKKEDSYVESISSGLYAIGEALNDIYKQNLYREHLKLFQGNQFKRRHSYYYPFNYYEFQPDHNSEGDNRLLPAALYFVNNEDYFDWSLISYLETEELSILTDTTENASWYDEYLQGTLTIPNLRSIIDNPATAEENELLITNTFRRDLIDIAKNPVHYLNEDLSKHNETLLPLAFKGKQIVSRKYRLVKFIK